MKISIINYIPRYSIDYTPRGHYIKTIKEYFELLINNFNVELIIDNYTSDYIDHQEIIRVKNNISTNQICYSKNIFRNIIFFINICKNIYSCIKKSSGELLIFLSPESTFYLVFPIFKLLFFNKRIAINIYKDNVTNCPFSFLKIITKYVYDHVDLIFSSVKDFSYYNSIFIPDFIFDKDKYINNKKNESSGDYFLCIGSISPKEKNYEELVSSFIKTKQKLIIAGPLLDEKLKNYLKNLVKDAINIELKLKYLSNEEYTHLITNAKGMILPYRKHLYYGRSSGVLLESIFFNKPVIAPVFLLKFNQVNGYGYDSQEKLEQIIQTQNLVPLDNSQLLSQYDINVIEKKIKEKIKSVLKLNKKL